jgi:hypothetical protein
VQVRAALQELESEGRVLAWAFCRQAAESVPEGAPPGCCERLRQKQTGMERWAWAHVAQHEPGVDQAAGAGPRSLLVTAPEARLSKLQQKAEELLQVLLDSSTPDDDRG